MTTIVETSVFIPIVHDWSVRLGTSTWHEDCLRPSDKGDNFFQNKLIMDSCMHETSVVFYFGQRTRALDVGTSALGALSSLVSSLKL